MHDAIKNTEKCVLKQLAPDFRSEGRYVHIITYRPVTEKIKADDESKCSTLGNLNFGIRVRGPEEPGQFDLPSKTFGFCVARLTLWFFNVHLCST